MVTSSETGHVALGGLDLTVSMGQGGVVKGQKAVATCCEWADAQQSAVTRQLP